MTIVILCNKTDCIHHMTHTSSFWFDSKYMPHLCRLEGIRRTDGKCIDYKKSESEEERD